MTHPMLTKHRDKLDAATAAIASRDYYSAYPESPSPRIYGETAAADGKAEFESVLGGEFTLDLPGITDYVATEDSPFGIELGVHYPRVPADKLITAAQAAWPSWRDTDPATRAGVCVEILDRIHSHVFALANAVHATTGQAFVMAFQAGGPHALDRGLEAVAYGYAEQLRTPATARWEKPAKGEPLVMNKTFHIAPRGIALVIGCNTFPTWNSYPGLFASLVTGNPVIVKPHPHAVLPLALTVKYAREVLAEAGFDPNLVTLAAEDPSDRVAAELATDPRVRIVDFTGSNEFGDWLEANARQAQVYTEKAGVNTIVVDSTDDFKGMCRNIAFTLSLYSGQMCTTSQAIFIPQDGIDTPDGRLSADEVVTGIATAVGKLTGDAERAVEIIGAIVSPQGVERITAAADSGEVVLASKALTHPTYPGARVHTPLLVKVPAEAKKAYGTECFGPITYLVTTADTAQSLQLVSEVVGEQGALTMGVYSTDEAVLDDAERTARDVAVHLSCNLTGGVFVNQSAAFSDFHGSGGNAAANAALTNPHYVSGRFTIVQSRRHG
ncbi:phenylacetic acid degradation protein paaN [Stackebrandtia endophytica]|uniref:Phenylacetic acid degradation protein paaN n=1 Tax=Stackebrandtia endophytica TaxID=1496996 RepID=A0A543AWK4_9ACTN|nr:phenylacetic acid degradation protein paaN [Stackebrandtia endophytica]